MKEKKQLCFMILTSTSRFIITITTLWNTITTMWIIKTNIFIGTFISWTRLKHFKTNKIWSFEHLMNKLETYEWSRLFSILIRINWTISWIVWWWWWCCCQWNFCYMTTFFILTISTIFCIITTCTNWKTFSIARKFIFATFITLRIYPNKNDLFIYIMSILITINDKKFQLTPLYFVLQHFVFFLLWFSHYIHK